MPDMIEGSVDGKRLKRRERVGRVDMIILEKKGHIDRRRGTGLTIQK